MSDDGKGRDRDGREATVYFGDDEDKRPTGTDYVQELLRAELGDAYRQSEDEEERPEEEAEPGLDMDGRPLTTTTEDTWAKAGSRAEQRMETQFRKPGDWWMSAEGALDILEKERHGLRKSTIGQPNTIQQGLLAANRFITTKMKELMHSNQRREVIKFRDGIEEISHILPPDTQREFHKRVCLAAKTGEMEVLNSLLRFQVDLDYSDFFGTPLHYASYFGNVEAVQLLLDHGAYPSAPNMRDQTPLHMAAEIAEPQCLDLLIHFGARVNCKDSAGVTALHTASRNGYVKLVQKLIQGGAECDLPNKLGWTPLHMASLGMHDEVIEMLCDQGLASVNVHCTHGSSLGKPGDPDYEIFETHAGDTPAHFAARKGHLLCLKALLEHGAKSNAVNERGETVMHAAVDSSDIKACELLLEHEWDYLGVEDKQGRDPVDHADFRLSSVPDTHKNQMEVRLGIQLIKDLLVKSTQKRNQMRHRELIEKAREMMNPKHKHKKKGYDDVGTDQMEQTEAERAMEEIEIDETTLEDKLTAMSLELEASRHAVKALQEQTRAKTHALNDMLIETKRRLTETEFVLERERDARLALEREVLETFSSTTADPSQVSRGQSYGNLGSTSAGFKSTFRSISGFQSRMSGFDDSEPDVLRIQSEMYSSSHAQTAATTGSPDEKRGASAGAQGEGNE